MLERGFSTVYTRARIQRCVYKSADSVLCMLERGFCAAYARVRIQRCVC